MATTITMPQLGETVTEGTVAQWLKKPGDPVEKYEAFLEVSTDKVNAEVPSPVTGTIKELLVQEGQTVPTGTPIAVIDEVPSAGTARTADPTSQVQTAAATGSESDPVPGAAGAPSIHVASAAPAAPASANGHPANGQTRSSSEAVLRGASPAVRRLAREHRIDIASVRGSGAKGRVTADDVLTAARMG
ncbi:MAG: E3 binding domain-containing protein, partial [Candidatus Eremiobacteraeota bacterium]|nr:E3 binding domain-containing protein [Candidatus Eremiobacteraeota bacterium]